MVRINLKRAERRVLPEGDYILNIAACEERRARSSGNKNLHIEYLVDEETHPEFGGVRLYSDISQQEQSWWRIVELLRAAGLDLSGASEEGDFDFDPADLIGAQVAAQVSVDDAFDGVPRNRIGAVFSVSEFGLEEEGEEEEVGLGEES